MSESKQVSKQAGGEKRDREPNLTRARPAFETSQSGEQFEREEKETPTDAVADHSVL